MKGGIAMNSIVNTIKNTVPISQFNRGLAGKIFAEVKKYGAKVVMKNNTPECVLLSPEEYTKMADEINDAKLLNLANERMEKFDISQAIPAEDVYKKLGITEEDLTDYKDVEIE